MAYLLEVEAAIELGYSVELIEKLMCYCPKKGQKRKLPLKRIDSETRETGTNGRRGRIDLLDLSLEESRWRVGKVS